MRKRCLLLLVIIIGIGGAARTQGSIPVPADPNVRPPMAVPDSTRLPIPTKESFINAIFHTVVDSSFSGWYLCAQAYPCSFVKYDYDEWVKYALQEDVDISILNELAKKSYYDRKPAYWQRAQLTGARCIPEEKASILLDPAAGLPSDTTLTDARQKKIRHRRWQHWSKLPPQDRTVFYFSRPLFTDDGRYAILDMDYRCDARQCGAGTTCLFRNTGSGWKLIGRRIRWEG